MHMQKHLQISRSSQFYKPKNKKHNMKSKLFSIALALVAVATLFTLSTGSAFADYPYRGNVHGSHVHHGNHVHYGPAYRGGGVNFGSGVGLSFGRGGVGLSIGGGYAPSRFYFQPNLYGPNYGQNYRNYRPTYAPNFTTPYVVPRYSNGAYRQFYIDPSNYQSNTAPYSYPVPAPYATGVDRYEFQRFQQETRDQLQQLSDQQRRTNVQQQQLERGQQQLQQGQQRLDREQQSLERELQDIQNLLRK